MNRSDSESPFQHDLFAPEKTVEAALAAVRSTSPQGTVEYHPAKKCRILIVKKIRSGGIGTGTLQMEVMLPTSANAAPGDRLIINAQKFVISCVEECRDLDGSMIALKCKIN